MTNTYAKAYTEVLEILRYLPKEEYKKIPREKIEFYENNKDDSYIYTFDTEKTLREQNISRKTKAIIVSLFKNFFATPIQREKLRVILKQNEEEHQKELMEKYNTDNLFKDRQVSSIPVAENMQIVEYKKPVWYKKILSIFKRN